MPPLKSNEGVVVFCSILTVLISIFNGLFILVFVKRKNLQTKTNYILFSLATSDLLVGMIITPLTLVNFLPVTVGHFLCLFINICLACAPLVAVFRLFSVSLERYVAIAHPLRYPSRQTRNRVQALIGCSWMLGVTLASCPFMGFNAYADRVFSSNNSLGNRTLNTGEDCSFITIMDCSFMFLLMGTLDTVCIVVLLMYLHIFRIAIGQAKRIVSNNALVKPCSRLTAARSELKAAVVIFATVRYFTLSVIPVSAAFFLHCSGYHVLPNVWSMSIFLFYSNSLVNPLIYGLGNREILHECSTWIKFWRPEQDRVSPE